MNLIIICHCIILMYIYININFIITKFQTINITNNKIKTQLECNHKQNFINISSEITYINKNNK